MRPVAAPGFSNQLPRKASASSGPLLEITPSPELDREARASRSLRQPLIQFVEVEHGAARELDRSLGRSAVLPAPFRQASVELDAGLLLPDDDVLLKRGEELPLSRSLVCGPIR